MDDNDANDAKSRSGQPVQGAASDQVRIDHSDGLSVGVGGTASAKVFPGRRRHEWNDGIDVCTSGRMQCQRIHEGRNRVAGAAGEVHLDSGRKQPTDGVCSRDGGRNVL